MKITEKWLKEELTVLARLQQKKQQKKEEPEKTEKEE